MSFLSLKLVLALLYVLRRAIDRLSHRTAEADFTIPVGGNVCEVRFRKRGASLVRTLRSPFRFLRS
jgi:hypothetical protein